MDVVTSCNQLLTIAIPPTADVPSVNRQRLGRSRWSVDMGQRTRGTLKGKEVVNGCHGSCEKLTPEEICF